MSVEPFSQQPKGMCLLQTAAFEPLRHATQVFGGLFGLAVMSFWLWRAGLPLVIVPLLLAACFVRFLTLTRVVVEGGGAVVVPSVPGPALPAPAPGAICN